MRDGVRHSRGSFVRTNGWLGRKLQARRLGMSRSIRTLKGGRLRRAAAIAAILPLALAACSSGGAGDEDDNGDGGGEGTSESGDPDGDLTSPLLPKKPPGTASWDHIA